MSRGKDRGPLSELETLLSELETLRGLVQKAEQCFDTGHEVPLPDPSRVLREGLRRARQDFDLLMDAQAGSPTGIDSSVFMAAVSRCELALALADYRARFGFPEEAQDAAPEKGLPS